MRTNTKLLVAALLAVVTLAGAVSIIQTSAYDGSPATCDDCNQYRQGAHENGADGNACQWRSRAMAQHGDQMGNAHGYCHRHGTDE